MSENSFFDHHVLKLLYDLSIEVEELRVERVNSPMMLKALLEAEESPLYNALLEQLYDMICFPELVDETYSYLPVSKKNKASKQKKNVAQEKVVEQNSEAVPVEEENIEPHIMFYFENECRTLLFDEDLKVFLAALGACLELDHHINILGFTSIFVLAMTPNVRKILRTFNVNTTLLKERFTVKATENDVPTNELQATTLVMPQELKGFVRNLNEELKGTTCDIAGRDRECAQVWQTLQKYSKSNAVLLGEPGVGKTSIVIKMVHDILDGTCPKTFKESTVLSLDVASSVAGTMYRGQAEQRFSALVDFLENQPNVILFIDEIHLINGAGACREGEVDLANTLKPILASGKVRVIGATTRDEYEKYFSRDGALKRRFRPVYVKEPKMKEVYPMLKKSIETLSQYHGVSITEEMVDFIILNASCFDNETCNPDRTKDLIDLAMVAANDAGKTEVDKESVLANFRYHFKQFAKMNDRAKRSTAYHEAGHCLVSMCSKELNNCDVIAVSIMPTDSYLGVTVYEPNDVTPESTMEYFIDDIARSLAGRVAEKMFTTTITSGACADLQMATERAYAIVSQYGMAEFGKNRSFTEETTNDKVKDRINEEIDKIIGKAMTRAEEIISVNHEILELLVEELMKNGIVGPNDLKVIFKGIEKM